MVEGRPDCLHARHAGNPKRYLGARCALSKGRAISADQRVRAFPGVLARWEMAGVHVRRVWPRRSVRAALSGTGTARAGLNGQRNSPSLGTGWSRALLHNPKAGRLGNSHDVGRCYRDLVEVFSRRSDAALRGRVRWHDPVHGWDVTPDGRRFLLTRPIELPPQPPSQMILVQNFGDELKRRVAAGSAK